MKNKRPQATYTQRRVQIQSWTPGAVQTKKRKGNLSQQPQKQRIKAAQTTWWTLHLWNTWIDNESSQIEEVDFGSNDIYIYFSPFSLFVSVYVYASLCDFVYIALLLPFVIGFCLSILVWFVFYYLKFFFLIIIFYFNNFILFYFILSSSFFFLFFLTFILSCVEDKLLMLQPGVRAVQLSWETQVQYTGPQETSQLHVISNSKNLPEISISMPRPSSTQLPASYSAGHPMPNN